MRIGFLGRFLLRCGQETWRKPWPWPWPVADLVCIDQVCPTVSRRGHSIKRATMYAVPSSRHTDGLQVERAPAFSNPARRVLMSRAVTLVRHSSTQDSAGDAGGARGGVVCV